MSVGTLDNVILKMFILRSFSSFNDKEVDEVMKYIRTLLASDTNLTESDVGVISPYKLQCSKIKRACISEGFERIQIGTSEVFQGQEKKVIILSTVVSRRGHPGNFVSDPQVRNLSFEFDHFHFH